MRQWTVDAFANGPFKGNPACVVEPFDCLAEQPLDAGIGRREQSGGDRIFAEDRGTASLWLAMDDANERGPVCGHATLAAAHVLFVEQKPDLWANACC
jgi:predicted PhzF superfamily epimerase YddE/YHI9